MKFGGKRIHRGWLGNEREPWTGPRRFPPAPDRPDLNPGRPLRTRPYAAVMKERFQQRSNGLTVCCVGCNQWIIRLRHPVRTSLWVWCDWRGIDQGPYYDPSVDRQHALACSWPCGMSDGDLELLQLGFLSREEAMREVFLRRAARWTRRRKSGSGR